MEHLPVLLEECIAGLCIKPGGIYVDGTLGRAGHSVEIAKRLDGGKLLAIDRDADAIRDASDVLSPYSGEVVFIRGNFADLSSLLVGAGADKADGMLFDLGVSSPQLDKGERGFSYMKDAPLDMRMDLRDGESAYDLVNGFSEDRLKKIFYEYGEERYSASIARAIVKKRCEREIKTTFELNRIILTAIPAAARREAQHPSKRCFQALRIAVNNELGSIEKMLEQAPDCLNTGGRICIISFHSLEDRLVKNAFAANSNGCTCPRDFPVCVCGFKPKLKLITKKPVVPGNKEISLNPRARSAKLRIAERL